MNVPKINSMCMRALIIMFRMRCIAVFFIVFFAHVLFCNDSNFGTSLPTGVNKKYWKEDIKPVLRSVCRDFCIAGVSAFILNFALGTSSLYIFRPSSFARGSVGASHMLEQELVYNKKLAYGLSLLSIIGALYHVSALYYNRCKSENCQIPLSRRMVLLKGIVSATGAGVGSFLIQMLLYNQYFLELLGTRYADLSNGG